MTLSSDTKGRGISSADLNELQAVRHIEVTWQPTPTTQAINDKLNQGHVCNSRLPFLALR
jgi:hypothetical protein